MGERKIRLDKYLADMGIGSRSEVKQYIKKGRIAVNGRMAKTVESVDRNDSVSFDGKLVDYIKTEYYMLNKPAGTVSAVSDAKEKTVLDCIQEKKRKDLFPVGRLDKDTEGLLLITNDGGLAHSLLSPKKHVKKVYYALIEGRVTKKERELFHKGLDIGEKELTLPAKLEIIKAGEKSEIELEIYEGKFHQVKRMFQAVGMKVIYLKRLEMGSLVLDPLLKAGEYRKLTEDEIASLKTGGRQCYEE
jgi:16S rRNA pseudouridine516 synthase